MNFDTKKAHHHKILRGIKHYKFRFFAILPSNFLVGTHSETEMFVFANINRTCITLLITYKLETGVL